MKYSTACRHLVIPIYELLATHSLYIVAKNKRALFYNIAFILQTRMDLCDLQN
ncbi:hypothetical protein LDG_8675 [Legionella drancourtii LLAP12]|uniref:Uncharacterized protein n=1 Tax=Legionella drancourtii LLAP12 TaxID=658187 RepID=G9ETP0_9GAMM|nr:hypothetical protein LDG_8675 [Legionella drancourtii LLAP12]